MSRAHSSSLAEILDARHVAWGASARPRRIAPWWTSESMEGRLVEIRAASASAQLTAAFLAVRDAQSKGAIAVWTTCARNGFYPPDAARAGVDLDALLVVRVSDAALLWTAADKLVRSGAVGLAVLDLASGESASNSLSASASRLAGLARKHATGVLLLPPQESADFGPLVSLRAEAKRLSDERIELRALRDKRGSRESRHEELCHGPPGMR